MKRMKCECCEGYFPDGQVKYCTDSVKKTITWLCRKCIYKAENRNKIKNETT